MRLERFKYKIIILFLLSVGAIISGRFSIVGIIVGFVFLLIRNFYIGRISKLFVYILSVALIIFITISGIYYYADMIEDPLMSQVINHYIIQPLDSVLVDGDFQTSSTDALAEMYKMQDIKPYLLFGSGRYTNPDGSYFGLVDAGYLRTLGYYGVLGFNLLIYCVYHICFKSRNSMDKYTKWAFFILFLVLNYKGDIQVYSNNIVPIIVGFFFFNHDCVNVQKYEKYEK